MLRVGCMFLDSPILIDPFLFGAAAERALHIAYYDSDAFKPLPLPETQMPPCSFATIA